MRIAAGTGKAAPAPTRLDLSLGDGGTTFIEASAGTGKTHALTTLVARLVLEEEWPIDRILVVTFTRAATAELRDRIRRVLGLTLSAIRAHGHENDTGAGTSGSESSRPGIDLDAGNLDTESDRSESDPERSEIDPDAGKLDSEPGRPEIDPQARDLLAAWERADGGADHALAARRLEAAMHDIDRANVFTIHGFCQRVLVDLAFESGFPFGCEVVGDGGAMVAGAVRDFWRRRMYPASMLLMRHAVETGFLPAGLAGWVSDRRAKVGAELVGCDTPGESTESRESAWRAVFDEVRLEWERDASGFCEEILEGPWLNRRSYAVRRAKRELAELRALFGGSNARLPPSGLAGRYGRERLSQACKKGFALPPNPMFDAFDRLEEASGELRATFDRWLRWTRREALTDARQSVRRRIRTDRRLAYDDLLIELDEALRGASGMRLAAQIRREFPCALIDEYQDTDPVQSRIFSRIWGADRAESTEPGGARPGPFIVVGDPKQSIYRFRGADVFAYLASRRTAGTRLHLDRNWRSVPALVEAVNAMFAGAAPFVTPEIEYRPVAAAEVGDSPLPAPSGAGTGPLELWLLPRPPQGKPLAKKDANPVVAGATANEVARVLECGARGEAAIGDRPLTGADVAVLVRTREQGRQMAAALRERGVRSIEIDDGSVFHTREAEQLERLLWALADPGREPRVRGALAGDLFGLDAGALLAFGDDEEAWSAWTARLADWRSHWESRGIGSVLLRLLEGEGGATHLLGRRDGARRLTNFRHLAELLQAAETRERLAPAELATWLNHRRADPGGPDDDVKLRIDSDEELVRIVTVHGSKGLEFPVVFCPFAWDARSPRRRRDAVDTVYHRGAADGYREVIDLDPDERAESVEWLEEFSESVRLLYVALTRAKYRCVVAWGQVYGAGHAPLAWLLHRSAGGSAAAPASGPAEPDTAVGDAGSVFGENAADAVMSASGARSGRDDPGIAVAEAGKDAGGNDTDTMIGAARSRSGDDDPDTAVTEAGKDAGGNGTNTTTGATGERSGGDDPDIAVAALRTVAARFDGLGAREWLGEVEAFARRLPGAVSTTVLDPIPPPVRAPVPPEGALPALAVREPRRPLRRIRSLTSFSALSAGAGSPSLAPGRSRAGHAEAEVDRPDHDQHQEPVDSTRDDTGAAGAPASEWTAFTFPRGPVAGSCLHRMFEHLDLAPAIGTERPDLDEICRDALADFGIDGAWRTVARTMVERTRSVLLREPEPETPDGASGAGDRAGSGGRTGAGDVPESSGDASDGRSRSRGAAHDAGGATESDAGPGSGAEDGDGRSTSHSVATRVGGATESGVAPGSGEDAGERRDAGPGAAIGSDSSDRAAATSGFRLAGPHRRLVELEFHFPVEGLDPDRLALRMVEHGYPAPFARAGESGTGGSSRSIHGFLRGFVDLVVEHAGRWYVLDYKSNWLGPASDDYGPEALAAAMHAGGYTLQSLIYLVALHRYLSVRLPGYEYERHVGGAFYLFVRGIDPAAGMRRGVHFDRPTAACLLALDDCFRRGEA